MREFCSLSTSSRLCKQKGDCDWALDFSVWKLLGWREWIMQKQFRAVGHWAKYTQMHTQAQRRRRGSEAENFSLVRGFSCHCLLPEAVLCVLIKAQFWIQWPCDVITIGFFFYSYYVGLENASRCIVTWDLLGSSYLCIVPVVNLQSVMIWISLWEGR